MKPKFFGRYLIENGCITEEQLSQAVAHQQQMVKRVGEIAVIHGFMTPDQVNEVVLEQRKKDRFFGELAVAMGFLTDEQLERVVAIQKHEHIHIGQALVQKRILTQEELDKYLLLFQEVQESVSTLDKVLPEIAERREEVLALLDICIKTFRRMANMPLKVGTGAFRSNEIENMSLISAIRITGDSEILFFLNIPAHVSAALTRKCYDDDKMACDDETIADCIGELTNVICGNATTVFFEMGINICIDPPCCILRSETTTWMGAPGKRLLIFPGSVPLPEGNIDIGFYL